MNEILQYFIKSLANSTLSLKKKGIFIEKPWALIDDDGEIQKLIFKKNKELILSKNGKVTEGKWDYFPEARCLMIDRVTDKLLLKEQYIDENVIILKKDGTDNDFFALANENSVPDYNVPKYLHELRCRELNIKAVPLFDGTTIKIINGREIYNNQQYIGLKVEAIDDKYSPFSIKNGKHISQDRKSNFYIDNDRIIKYSENCLINLFDGTSIEIEEGDRYEIKQNVRKGVTINGRSVNSQRLISQGNTVFDLQNSVIMAVYFIKTYILKNDWEIKIEQKVDEKIRMGDKIVGSKPISPLPDGKYKINGRFWKINVKDQIII